MLKTIIKICDGFRESVYYQWTIIFI